MDRYESTRCASILGIIANIFLLIIKMFAGIITHSQAMIADSVNSAGDIFSSLMTYIGNKIASKPSDDDHNLGHGKAEYIFSLLISISIIVVSIKVCFDSTMSLLNPSDFKFSKWLIVICSITIFIKLLLYIYTHKLAKKYNNLLIEANAHDHRNDCLLTTINLIASILGLFEIYWFDSLAGMFISIWIFITGFKIFIESYNILMDKSIDNDKKEKILEVIKKYPEIKRINHFNSTPVGYKYQISFTIFVDGNLTTFESHDIANRLERELENNEDIYLTIIHVNPIEIKENN